MNTFLELAKARFAVRKFVDTPVPQEIIDSILEAAQIAPTAANRQPQRIKVVQTAEDIEKFDKCSPCRYGAPLVFVVCYDSENVISRRDGSESSGQVDAAIVTTHMMLQAKDMGVDTLWAMMFDMAKLREEFNIPESVVPVVALAAGYPAPDVVPNPFHTDKKPISEYML